MTAGTPSFLNLVLYVLRRTMRMIRTPTTIITSIASVTVTRSMKMKARPCSSANCALTGSIFRMHVFRMIRNLL